MLLPSNRQAALRAVPVGTRARVGALLASPLRRRRGPFHQHAMEPLNETKSHDASSKAMAHTEDQTKRTGVPVHQLGCREWQSPRSSFRALRICRSTRGTSGYADVSSGWAGKRCFAIARRRLSGATLRRDAINGESARQALLHVRRGHDVSRPQATRVREAHQAEAAFADALRDHTGL